MSFPYESKATVVQKIFLVGILMIAGVFAFQHGSVQAKSESPDHLTYLLPDSIFTYYADSDGDLYGDAGNYISSNDPFPPAGYTMDTTDCDDTNPDIHPGAIEICNGADDNCNGETDEGLLTTFYADNDGDTYGDLNNAIQDCSLPAGYVTSSSDCDDTNPAIHPDGNEVCNGYDDDCNGFIDEITITATITPSGGVVACNNNPVQLLGNAGTALSYQWIKNGVPISGATNRNYGATSTGAYFVIVSSASSCPDSSSTTQVTFSPVVTNATATALSSCEIFLSWSAIPGVHHYLVSYKLTNGTPLINVNTGSNTSCTISGLSANKSYSFKIRCYCSASKGSSATVSVSKKTLSCSPAKTPTATSISFDSTRITWTHWCQVNGYKLNYRVQGQSSWISIPNVTDTTYLLTGLLPSTIYEYQVVSICGSSKIAYTSIFTFTTPNISSTFASHPNIIFIMLDDCRYDVFQPNGGPSWFETPAINRIADEGVNFQLMCPSTAQCAPSRSSIYTGLYGHDNGCMSNGDDFNHSLPIIPQILKNNGYFTGFLGKWGQFLGHPEGFNWVCENFSYDNGHYVLNGTPLDLPGHICDVYPSLTMDFLNLVPDSTPFFFMLHHHVPHLPTTPTAADDSLYLEETLPFPQNFYTYVDDYPSYFYTGNLPSQSEMEETILHYYQTVRCVDDNVAMIFDWLEEHGRLDSTLIIFTSDNGYMLGNHMMEGKRICQDESMRVPLFMRYPPWFDSSTVITDEIASTIDFAPTFLELAGIENIYGFYGLPLNQLAEHQMHRKTVLTEFGKENTFAANRAIRSLDYKYVKHFCQQLTEEFFDLVNDPAENINLINDTSYSVLIQEYRFKMDSLRAFYNDTIDPNLYACYLVNNIYPRMMDDETFFDTEEKLNVFPNPFANELFVEIDPEWVQETGIEVKILNELNQLEYQGTYPLTNTPIQLNMTDLSEGIYSVIVQSGEEYLIRKIVRIAD